MGIFDDIWDGVKSVVGGAVNNSPVGVIVKTATGDTLTKTGGEAIDLGLKTKGGASIAKAVGNDGGSVLGGLRKSLDGGGRVATVLGGGDHTHNKPHRDKDGNKVTPLHDEADKDKEKDNVAIFASFANEMLAHETKNKKYTVRKHVVNDILKEKIRSFPTESGDVKLKRGQLVLFNEQNYSENMIWDTHYSHKSRFKKEKQREEKNIRVWIKVSCFQGKPWGSDGWVRLYKSDTDTYNPLFKRFLSGEFKLYRTEQKQKAQQEGNRESLVPDREGRGGVKLLP